MPLDDYFETKALVDPGRNLIPDEPVKRALVAAMKAEADFRAAEERVTAAEAALEQARIADAEAAADAIRARKPDPGRVEARVAEEALADARHSALAHKQNRANLRAQFHEALGAESSWQQRMDGWTAEFDELMAESIGLLQAALEKLRRRTEVKAVKGWQSDLGVRFVAQRTPQMGTLTALIGEITQLDRAVRSARVDEQSARTAEAAE